MMVGTKPANYAQTTEATSLQTLAFQKTVSTISIAWLLTTFSSKHLLDNHCQPYTADHPIALPAPSQLNTRLPTIQQCITIDPLRIEQLSFPRPPKFSYPDNILFDFFFSDILKKNARARSPMSELDADTSEQQHQQLSK